LRFGACHYMRRFPDRDEGHAGHGAKRSKPPFRDKRRISRGK
jgi:hypothetical protein